MGEMRSGKVFPGGVRFCNAGFDLHGNKLNGGFVSLTGFNHDPIVLMVTAALIVAGGLGFMVWLNVISHLKGSKLIFHSRLVLRVTAILILGGTVFYWLLEFRNTNSAISLGSLPWYQQPFATLFQSVTTRTAGFNSIDQLTLADSSKFLTVILMFIGAAPASTGGVSRSLQWQRLLPASYLISGANLPP